VGTVALRDVTKIFADGTIAVDNLSLDVAAGELMVLLGQYGCGKSTVLRMVAGLEDPSSGAIMLNGVPASEMPAREHRITTQFPYTGDGSGGPSRRMARRPGLFLLDEPLSACDSGLRPQFRAQLAALVRELGVTTIYVTDDQAEALTMADRVAILRRGALQDVGTPTQVYNRPATLYVAAFLGGRRMNLLEAYVDAHAGRHIALHLGVQQLHLPWDDTRSRAVANHHGERVVVGVRAEALAPVGPDAAGNVLRGRVQHVERHGRDSLAMLDIGAIGVAVEGLGGAPAQGPPPERSRLRRINQAVQRFTGRVHAPAGRARTASPGAGGAAGACAGSGAGPTGGWAPATGRGAAAGRLGALSSGCAPSLRGDPGRHRRVPAELAVRLDAQPDPGAGEAVVVTVRMDALHFFDEHGRRIDSRWRSG